MKQNKANSTWPLLYAEFKKKKIQVHRYREQIVGWWGGRDRKMGERVWVNIFLKKKAFKTAYVLC